MAGDLLNQNVTANFVARHNQIPFLCMFGACSTSMETLATGAALVDAGFANRVIASASSHNATAERQFRNPTEYGGQNQIRQRQLLREQGQRWSRKKKVLCVSRLQRLGV